MEERTARLTLLIDPRKKALFETLCAKEDVTPSQKVRQLIREYIEARLGTDWMETATGLPAKSKPSRSGRTS
ncbi:MAG: CopG family transcriptional regulator [Hahellaceae bacterium]|nr:CopG family transcriptional regulator [Hahellaceae bacterium]